MSKKNYLVVTTKSWNIENFNKLKKHDYENNWHIFTEKEDFSYDMVKKINPRYIFFPHWSWIIPKNIYDNFECAVFHMTDLPYGRGGSPLQNLIVRGHKETKLSAIQVVKELDAGGIYLKENLDLSGTAEQIFKRASEIVFQMIEKIIKTEPNAQPQNGEVVEFKRRKPSGSDIGELNSLDKIYDYIRMLDAEGYPPAFLENNNIRLEFNKAKKEKDYIKASVKIILK